MKRDVNKPCVVCGATASRLLHAVAYPDHSYPGLFEMRECMDCGLLFNSPRLDDDQIARLYDGAYYVFRERERDAIKRVAALASQTVGVAQQFTDAREVLEVGCAKGYLLALLQSRGWQARGVEISPQASTFARARFGLQVFTGKIESWVVAPTFAPAPLVVCTDVIEHVTDPLAFLNAMHAAIVPGGWLVVGTPNAASDHRQALGPDWLGFNPFHIMLFARETLGRLLLATGFTVVHSYTYTNGDPPARPHANALRPAVRSMLRRSGLLPAMRRARSGLRALVDTPIRPASWQAETHSLGTYLESADARSPRRLACRGDNLVVIARRSS